ncbi:MAG TPA: hypothetical protein VNO70_10925, partial [Blastocatellia bacterium]|nr:hypothetical protein [Blastocatellia bacterium]
TSLNFEEVRNPFLLPSRFDEPFLLNAPSIQNIVLPRNRVTPFPVDYALLPGCDTESGNRAAPCLNNGFGGAFATGPVGQVIVSGYSPLGVDVFNFPQGRANNTFQYADTVIMDYTNQRFTFGADIRRNQLNSFLNRNFRPVAVFSAAANLLKILGDQLPGNPGSGRLDNLGNFLFGSDFAAVGAPTGFYQTQALVPDSTIGLRYWQNNFFFVDQIRARPNFTLTFGARYELNTVPTEVNRRIENTFNSPEVLAFQQAERQITGGVSGLEQFLDGRDQIFQRDNNNIAPHIAFAWDPFEEGVTSVRGGYGIYFDQIPGAVISQSRNVFPSFITLNTAGLSNIVAPDLNFRPINPSLLAANGTLNTFDRAFFPDPVAFLLALEALTNRSAGPGFVLPSNDLVTPYAQHWTLTIEHEFARDYFASAGYVGTRGVHLLRFATPNLGPNSIPVILDVAVNAFQPTFQGIVVPPNIGRPFPILGSFTSIESDANSIYHGLQLQLNKRFSRGIQFTTAYTWSHAIDEVSDLFDLAGTRALPQSSFNREAERGDANFDVRHRFVYSFIWDLPIFELSPVWGGWQLSSIGTFQTGQPYSVLFCCDANLDGNLTDRVNPEITLPGRTGRNLFRAPGIYNVDLALDKTFRFNDRQNLEVRAEVFNVFNRSHFGIPVNQLFFGGFTVEPLTQDIFVDTRLPKRTIQFALKYNF